MARAPKHLTPGVGNAWQPPELADSRLIDPDKLLDANLNEVFLYHGTSYDVASIITQHGFDER